MFKNTKRFISLVLPVVAITATSCGNATKTVTYDQIRQYAVDNYDQYALDTVPAVFTANFNTLYANILVEYKTPEGGEDAFTIGFGLGGIHVTFNDKYAVSLSSVLIDNIEKYYSDFVGFAVSLKEEPPIKMIYQLASNNCAKIDVTTNEKLVGSVLVKLLQMLFGAFDIFSSTFGYLPEIDEEKAPTNPALAEIYEQIIKMSSKYDILDAVSTAFEVMNYAALTISNSSEAHGETFKTYITTDNCGFVNKLDFNFKSSFKIAALVSPKKYASDTPKEGDRPINVGSPYQVKLTGSIDFDFDVLSQIVR